MKDCSRIDALVTPYVDGEGTPAQREDVASHLQRCPPCDRHASAERLARNTVRACSSTLVDRAPDTVRQRCRSAASRRAAGGPALGSLRRWPLAMAATMVLALAGALAYGTLLNPAVATAAQLTTDHLKCFAFFEEPAALEPAQVRDALKRRYGWDIAVPDAGQVEGLTLVGGRHCLYLDGSLAHLLYRMGSVPVSVFVLPEGEALGARSVDVMGYAAVSFERGGRTWVVLAREDREAVGRIADAIGGAASRADRR